jgi:hypothetical protein
MKKLMDEIRYDLKFLVSHTTQPKWWKITKVFVLMAFLTAYALLLGISGMLVFLAAFILCCLVIHFTYRAGTKKYTRSWLDFRIGETDASGRPRRIGRYYYPAVLTSAILAFLASLALT